LRVTSLAEASDLVNATGYGLTNHSTRREREQSLSHACHRYGNLGPRSAERRAEPT